MARSYDELLKKLLVTFRIEADEHLQTMSSGLLALEKTPAEAQRTEIVETIFRAAHSLKGAARAVNLSTMESVCHSLESVFAGLKDGRLSTSPPLFDLLHQTISDLGRWLSTDEVQQPQVEPVIRQLENALKGSLRASKAPVATPRPAPAVDVPAEPVANAITHVPTVTRSLAPDTVRVSTWKLDAVLRQAEELLAPRLAAGQRARELREAAATLADWKKQRLRIQPALRRIERSLSIAPQESPNASEGGNRLKGLVRGSQQLSGLLEYLDAEQLNMKMLEDRLARLSRSADNDQRMLVGMTDSLLHDVKEMQLLPFASLLEILPRFGRELAREQGKKVELEIRGGEIEIDRRILDEMKDPLIHLLRNSIDHGIEKPEVREAKRKSSHGTITLLISQQDSGKVEVLVTDDGAGIDIAQVQAAASNLGVMSAEEAERLGEQDALALVLQSGVTTSPIITDVSGRGLGLAIVREVVDRLGGSIAIESAPDAGTAFRIVLPLALANFRGVIVRASGQLFAIPAANVERVARMAMHEVQTVENRETIPLDGQAVSLVWLGDVLEIPRSRWTEQATDKMLLIVLGVGIARVAFCVQEVLGEQQVLVKALGRQLARVRNVAGASVLGMGQVVPVLNVSDLLKSAVKFAAAPAAEKHVSERPREADKQSILVVEDSITSRSLLKSILESAGYRVATAVDGADGYTTLKTGTFDLIVSDVEMPRMDGFDLTAKVRADKQLGKLPVVLVTALETREHRERGIDVGANAYIVKSSFDQSNLLEVIRRLI